MTDSGLSAVFLVAIVLLAVVSGGTTYALFSDTESVTVSVEIDTVPADPVKTDGTSNRTTVQLFTCPGPAEALSDGANSSATNASGAPAANETASNGTESDGTVCPRQPGDGPRPLGSTDGNTTN